jgi:hypothetical protein
LLLCRPDGSFPQPMAAVPEGTIGDSCNRIVRRVQTAVQKHQPECSRRINRREQSIIFRNSHSCKALCLHSPTTPKAWCLYETFGLREASFIKGGRKAFSVTISQGLHDNRFSFISRRTGASSCPRIARLQAFVTPVETHAPAPWMAHYAVFGQD